MDRAEYEAIAGQLRGLLIGLDDRPSSKDATLVAEFIDVGELGLALEQMADQLSERLAEPVVHMCARSRSGPDEAERHDGYAVAASVRAGAGIDDDDGVKQGVAQSASQCRCVVSRSSDERELASPRILVDDAAYDVPHLRNLLPLVEEKRSGATPDLLGIGRDGGSVLPASVQPEQTVDPLLGCRGLAHCLGSVDGDGWDLREQFVQFTVDDPAAILHHSLQLAGPESDD